MIRGKRDGRQRGAQPRGARRASHSEESGRDRSRRARRRSPRHNACAPSSRERAQTPAGRAQASRRSAASKSVSMGATGALRPQAASRARWRRRPRANVRRRDRPRRARRRSPRPDACAPSSRERAQTPAGRRARGLGGRRHCRTILDITRYVAYITPRDPWLCKCRNRTVFQGRRLPGSVARRVQCHGAKIGYVGRRAVAGCAALAARQSARGLEGRSSGAI